MMGPDYAWWHGMYEVAKHFYNKFLPEVEHLMGGKQEASALLDELVFKDERHRWYKEGMSKQELERMRQFYERRYGGEKVE
jgi:hypothetical protein